MSHSVSNDLVLELSRDLVMELAPEELPLFRGMSQLFRQDPKRVLASHEARDNMMGFGIADAAPLLTPVVLTVVSVVINFLIAEVTKATSTESSVLIQSTVRRIFKTVQSGQENNDKGVTALTREQLTEVRTIVWKEMRQAKLSDARAKLLADAIVGRLATAVGG